MASRAQSQYLARYAEPEARELENFAGRFGHVVTIPAYGEGTDLHDAIASVPAGPLGEVLIVLVVNGRADSPPTVRDANLTVLDTLCGSGGPIQSIARNATLRAHPRGALLLVDRASQGRELPARQGVGLARKIAADIALALWMRGHVASPWIHCTDADVELPIDYFEAPARLDSKTAVAALAYPFRHVNASREALEYEISLRYYVAGLRFAESPYAFHTIGSTLAVRADAYAQVRGFPKRQAAEDFYLLNKLAKVGAVETLEGLPIRVSARTSNRTPFGTGRALERAKQQGDKRAPLLVYHPEVFANLAAWLRTLHALAEAGSASDPADLLAKQTGSWATEHPERLRSALDRTGAWAAARRALERSKQITTRKKHLQTAFDGFQTLKLIHALRESGLASTPLRDALSRAPFIHAPAHAPLEEIREQLAGAESGST
jgi:hypothetical protein